MPKWSLRKVREKRAEKEALTPQMREMLLKLDGVYEMQGASRKSPSDASCDAQTSHTAQRS
jgi:hypothetical protein